MSKKTGFRMMTLLAAAAVCLWLILPAVATTAAKPGDYGKKLVQDCQKQNQGLDMQEAKKKLTEGGYVFLDVRTEVEYKKGHLPKSVNVPRGKLEFAVEKEIPDYNARIVVYCKTGGRACLAAATLRSMGYQNVVPMMEGFDNWLKAGLPVAG